MLLIRSVKSTQLFPEIVRTDEMKRTRVVEIDVEGGEWAEVRAWGRLSLTAYLEVVP